MKTTTMAPPRRRSRRLPVEIRSALEYLTRQIVFATLALITLWGFYKVYVEYPATLDVLGCYGFHPGRMLF